MPAKIDFEKILALDGVKVLDTSFLDFYMGRFSDENSIVKQDYIIDQQLELYSFLEDNFNKHFIATSEVLGEFERMGISFKRHYRSSRRTLSNWDKPDKARGMSSRLRREGIEEFLQKQNKLIGARKKFLREFLRKNPSEKYIVSNNDWERILLPSVLEVASRPGVKMDFHGRKNGYIHMSHALNDQRIFAKALEISRRYPVCILTSDGDFPRMQREYYREHGDLSKSRNGFGDFRYNVEVLFFSKEGKGSLVKYK